MLPKFQSKKLFDSTEFTDHRLERLRFRVLVSICTCFHFSLIKFVLKSDENKIR